MSAAYRSRISRIKKLFEDREESAALVVSSAPPAVKNRDTHYPYRQNSDFYYLTGCQAEGCSLLISSKKRHSVLLVPKFDPVKAQWDGFPPNFRKLAASLGAELVEAESHQSELLARVKDHDVLYHQNIIGTESCRLGRRLADMPSFSRASLPRVLKDIEEITEPLRLYKDRGEISLIKHAARITNQSLKGALPFVTSGALEAEIGHTLEYLMKVQGATPAFNTIVAAGSSASVLHYLNGQRRLKSGELLLIDLGAEYQMYAADITRVVPVSGKFTPLQAELYDVVLSAQKAAIKAVRSGRASGDLYNAAARELCVGLIELGVLRGKASKLMAKNAYKPFFPHGIGHTLGLDTHDIGRLRGNNSAKLSSGMVMTIEPGLYFLKKTGKIPACGIRIEDDVLVTAHGCEVLSAGFPKERSEIEAMI